MSLVTQTITPPVFLQLLSHEIRWQLLRVLATTDMHVQELVDALKLPQNLVSYHLRKLHEYGILKEHRSIADGREIYYSLDLDHVRASYMSAGESLHPGLVSDNKPGKQEAERGSKEIIRVLFLCTHNSARSQIAEAILRSQSKGTIDVHSAGTEATGIHPMAIRALSEMNIDIGEQFSKTMDRYLGQRFDYIITVCDRAKESCPVFPGDPVRIHWSFPDPSTVEGSDAKRYEAFKETSIQMLTRISYLMMMIKRRYGMNLD